MANLVSLGLVELTDNGMDLHGLDFEDVENALDIAVKIKNVGSMAIGAIVHEGRQVFAEDQIDQAITARNIGHVTAERYARVWAAWKDYEWASYLRATSFTHLDAVYTLPIEKRREILDNAITNDLPRETVRQMAQEARGNEPKPPKTCPNCGAVL